MQLQGLQLGIEPAILDLWTNIIRLLAWAKQRETRDCRMGLTIKHYLVVFWVQKTNPYPNQTLILTLILFQFNVPMTWKLTLVFTIVFARTVKIMKNGFYSSFLQLFYL